MNKSNSFSFLNTASNIAKIAAWAHISSKENMDYVITTLAAQRKEYEEILNQIASPICVTDGPNHRIMFVNNAYQSTFGISDSALGLDMRELFPEAYNNGMGAILNKVFLTGEVISAEEIPMTLRHANGVVQNYYVNYSCSPKRNSESKIVGVISTMTNVTTQALIRQSVEKNQAQLNIIMNAIPASIVYLDQNLRYQFVNDYTTGNIKKDQSDKIGKTLLDVIGEDAFKHYIPWLSEVLKGKPQEFKINYQHKDGRISIYQHTAHPDFDMNGNVRGIVSIAWDRTKTIQAEKDLKEARDIAEQANAAKSAFLANMSHEIRTPLGAIMGFAELARQSDVSHDEREKFLSVIERNSEQVLRIIDDILDLSKVEAGRVTVENIEFSLTELLADFASAMSFRARENGIGFIACALSDLPDKIVSDPTRIKQILTNAVGNAIKFTANGLVRLDVHFENNTLEFVVSDSGRGISPEQAQILFQPFIQADTSTTRKFGGTGLGLVLTRKLCQLMGGNYILVHSELDKGSTFKASIHAETPSTVTLLAKENVLFKSVPPPFFPSFRNQFAGTKILVVEDAPDNQALLKVLLSQQGVEIDIANNGQEGVTQALKKSYDLILMDIQMPVMDGHQAVRLLREHGYQGPIIALSAHAMKEEVEKARTSGFTDYISKPVTRKNLVSAVLKYTNQPEFSNTPGSPVFH